MLSQSVKKPAVKVSVIPLAPCATLGDTKSCKTFNSMLTARDADFTDLQKTSAAYVCFRPSIDSFFRFNFQQFEKSLYKNQPSESPEFAKNSMASYDSYLDGQDNGSYLFGFRWNWVKGVPDTAEAKPYSDARDPQGIQDLYITETSIHLVIKFKNIKDEQVTQTIDIRRSIGRYSLDTMRNGENEHENGSCVKYPR
jgi:hypothetical protein